MKICVQMECKFWFLPKNEGVTNLCNSLVFSLSGQKDSNLRPPAPKAGALAGLRHTPKKKTILHRLPSFAEKGGFEPPVPIAGYDSLANCWFQPLTHLSSALNCGAKVGFFPIPASDFYHFFWCFYFMHWITTRYKWQKPETTSPNLQLSTQNRNADIRKHDYYCPKSLPKSRCRQRTANREFHFSS